MQKPFTIRPPLFVHSSDLDHPTLHGLGDAEAVIDRSELQRLKSSICGSRTGRSSYPLPTLFRRLLSGIWYRLSDEQLAPCLFRDLRFRKFCRLELDGPVPDATTLGRSRAKLVERDLWDLLLGEVDRQLEAEHVIITEGRVDIIDATAIEAAQSASGKDKQGAPIRDAEAGWHVTADGRGHNTAAFGFSVPTGADEDGFIHRKTDWALYKKRHKIEIMFGMLKQYRRVFSRYDKLSRR